MVYYVIMAATLVFFLLLHVLIFPAMFLKGRTLPAGDRAVRDIPEEGGRSIIYATDKEYGSHIKHYIVSQREGKKLLTCEVDKDLRYIEYDVRMFNSSGEMFKVFTVKQVLDGSGIAGGAVELDKRTAYVNIIVRTADDKKLPVKKSHEVSRGGIFMYFLCATMAEIACAFAVKICMVMIVGSEYGESFLTSTNSTIVTLAVCAVMLVLNIIITGVSLKKYTRGKAVKRGNHA